uniref:Uncharacterized protein n=1 Tax=Noctiluca scintillans TaxID=2966 RepID=A0A7S1ALL1_NOCSC
MLDVLRARAEGEIATSRSGPALNALQELNLHHEKMQKHAEEAKPEWTLDTLKCSPSRVEQLLQVVPPRHTHAEKQLPTMESLHLGPSPKLPSREQLVSGGPFPLQKRMAELATHTYYLWGDTRWLSRVASGSEAMHAAHATEGLAKQAHTLARRLLHHADIPAAQSMPQLPISAASLPRVLVLQNNLFDARKKADRYLGVAYGGFL